MSDQSATEVFDHRAARRAGVGAFVGTAIEWYDFYIYATAAALVFGDLFFPEGNYLAGVMASFGTYAVGFFVRPLGGVIFGHLGDRIGRQPTLVLTLVLMGVSTLLVGLLPTYASIGVWAPILLVALRVLQGLAVGGEWGGAVLMAVEHAPEKFKTFYGGFAQLGNPAGALGATAIFGLLSAQGDDFVQDGGWRIPFLLSAVLIVVGFWIRRSVEESPVFEQEVDGGAEKTLPLKFALQNNWRPILLGIGLLPVSTGGYAIVTTFMTSYGTGPDVEVSETLILSALSVASFFELVATLPTAWMGDKIGRKRVMYAGLVASAVVVFPLFLTLGAEREAVIYVMFTLIRLAMTATYAPVATIMSQLFVPEARYTSVSLAYSIGAAVWAGLTPVVATGLYGATDTIWSVLILFVAMTVLSLVCLARAPQLVDEASPSATPVA